MKAENWSLQRNQQQPLWPGTCSVIGLLLGIGCWLLDAAVAYFATNQGSFGVMTLHPGPADLWMRIVIMIIFTGIGVAADIYLHKTSKSTDAIDLSDLKLTDAGQVNSEVRLRGYFEAGVIGMAIISPDMELIQINDKFCEITGYTRDELLGMKFTSITHPDDIENGVEKFERARNGEIDGFEANKRYIRKDGSVINVIISTKYIYSTDGSMAYSVGFVQDVTEHKLVEKELRERESRLREAQRIAKLGFWEWDLVRDKLYWSDELYSLLNLKSDEFIVTPDSLQELIHPEDRSSFYEHFNAVLENDIPFKHEHRIQLPDGGIHYHRVQGVVIRDASGLPIRTFGTVLDITEQKLVEKALLLYEHIVNASTDAMAVIDTDYRYLAVNQYYLDAFQVTRDTVIGSTVTQIIGKENFESFAKPNIDRALSGVPSNMQGWSYQPGFGKRYLDIYDKPLRDEEGKVFGVVINAHDITERKLAEDELMRNEELLRRYYEVGSVGMAMSSPEKGFFQFNDTFCEIVGHPREKIANLRWRELIHPDDCEHDKAEMNRILNGETDGFTLDKRVIREDGETVYVTTAVKCARKADGSVDYLVTFVQDITERKIAEQALIKSEERFAKVVQSTIDVVNITRLSDGLILFTNDGFTSLLGYPQSEWTGKTTLEMNIWRNSEDRIRLLRDVKNGEVRGFETEVINKAGEVIPVSLTASLIEIDNEECMVTWAHDLREEKRAENERWKLELQLFRSQKMEAIGQLTGGIAHDFNNILASILGYTNLALRRCDRLDEPRLGEYLKEVIHGGERARDLIQQMMMYSRSVPSVATSQSLQPLVENAIKLLRPMFPSNIDIQVQLPVDMPDIMVDPAQFEQTIMNLCINARDAINGSGLIELELYRADLKRLECASCHAILNGDFVVLSVKDSGCGIDEKISPLIFDPFYTTKDVGHGTGMGLSMIHGIMHNSGGHILLDSMPGKGSTFSLLFPITKKAPGITTPPTPKQMEAQQPMQKRGHIMIVDDEQSITGYLGELLESMGYRVIVMNSGEKALEKFRESRRSFDLVITDQTMPGITGTELAREILSLSSDTPIILISGYSEMMNEETAMAKGIRAYFTKPLDENSLLDKIDELLSEEVSVT